MTIEELSLILGIIGTFTGLASLIWHIINSRPKLKASAYFTTESEDQRPRGKEVIYIKITFRNTGIRSLTVENLDVSISNKYVKLLHFHPINVQGSSSEEYSYPWVISENEYNKIFYGKMVPFDVCITHTFGYTQISGESTFWTRHFTIDRNKHTRHRNLA